MRRLEHAKKPLFGGRILKVFECGTKPELVHDFGRFDFGGESLLPPSSTKPLVLLWAV